MLVIYDFRVVPDLKTPHITTLESYITIVKCFIILTTEGQPDNVGETTLLEFLIDGKTVY